MALLVGDPDLMVDNGGDLTLLIHEDIKKAEKIYEKLTNTSSTDNSGFQIVLSIIRDGWKSDPKRYLKETFLPISEETTTTGVNRREDAQTLKALQLPENPLILICKRRQLSSVIEEIERRKLEFYGRQLEDLKDGCTTFLRLACVKGDVEMVRTLVGLNSQLFLVEDNFSMIPLHVRVTAKARTEKS